MVPRPGSGAAGHTLGRRAHSVSGGKNPIRERYEVQLADSDKGAIHLSVDLPQDGEAPHAKARAKQVHCCFSALQALPADMFDAKVH